MNHRVLAAFQVFPTPGVWPAIWCVTAAAIYGCVPETTDQMGGVAIVVFGALVTELTTRRRLPWPMHVTIAALLLWAGMYGDRGRDSATVGALFAFWPAVIVPLFALVYAPTTTRPEPVRWVIAAVAGVASLVVCRTGALQDTVDPAFRAVAIWGSLSLAAGVAVLVATRRRSESQRAADAAM